MPPALQAAVQAAQQPAVYRMAGMPDDEESFGVLLGWVVVVVGKSCVGFALNCDAIDTGCN